MNGLLDRLHSLQSRLDQRGTVWDDEKSSDLKRRVRLLSGLLDRSPHHNQREIERSIFECEIEWEQTMNTSDPTEKRETTMAGQKAWKRLVDIESKFKNLEKTVAPHEADWWNQNVAHWRDDMDQARAMLNGSQGEPGPLTEEQCQRVSDVLDRLEQKELTVAEELGSRTAAGRAKAG